MEAEVIELELVALELKYCERCGGLWLRPFGMEEVYCTACIPKVAEFPVFHRRGPRPISREHDLEVEGTIHEVLGWCGPGGNA